MHYKWILLVLGIVLTSLVGAQEETTTSAPMVFKTWKQEQIRQAQNLVLRLTNQIHLIKNSRLSHEESTALNTELQRLEERSFGRLTTTAQTPPRVRKASELVPLQRAEIQLKRAQENLLFARDLSIEDYFEIYLPTVVDRPQAIQQLAEQYSKGEVADLIRVLVKKKVQSTALDSKQYQLPVASEHPLVSKPQAL